MKNTSINVIKGIACILVIFIHVPFPGIWGNVVSRFAQVVVPFFFMISGYYSYNASFQKLLCRVKKVLYMFIVSSVIYLAYGLLANMSSIGAWFIDIFSIKNIIKFFLLNRCLYASHLWFLPALIYVYFVCIIVKKMKFQKLLYWSIPILLLARVFVVFYIDRYSPLAFNYADNFLFTGLPYFYFGMLLNERSNMFYHIPKSLFIISFFASESINIVLYIFSGPVYSQPFVIFASMVLFILCVCYPKWVNNHLFEYIGERISLYVYIIHVLLLWVFRNIINSSSQIYTWVFPLFIMVLSLLGSFSFACIVKLVSHYRSFKVDKCN